MDTSKNRIKARNVLSQDCSKCPPRMHLVGRLLTNLLFLMVKTALLYLVPIKSYSKDTHPHSFFEMGNSFLI
jgi:hypothetical protein